MTYEQTKEKRIRAFVESSLMNYKKDPTNVSAGYAIIRYAKEGLLSVDRSVDPNVFVDWYPRDPSYVFLRLAKAGKLSYKII